MRASLALLPLLLSLAACGGGGVSGSQSDGNGRSDPGGGGSSGSFFNNLPAHFPKPLIPADNALTAAKVELGRHLFYDKKLSGNGTQSCGTCHLQSKAFTDGVAGNTGSTGEVHPRNSMSLANTAYNLSFNWGDPRLLAMEQQNLQPIINTDPVELGVNDSNRSTVLGRFRGSSLYQGLFTQAFPGQSDPYTVDNIVKALASFNRVILSYRAPFDRFEAGDANALSAAQKRGLALFNSERLECNVCHGGFNFSESVRVTGNEAPVFRNTGLYNITGSDGSADNYPPRNQGRFEITRNPGHKGQMRAPTLRNIALTAPYNHDGSVATLSEVLDHYARGGRNVVNPITRFGDGRTNSVKDGEIHGFTLTAAEKADLLAFFDALTDTALTTDPSLADPFAQ